MRVFEITWKLLKYGVFYKFTPYRGECFGRRLKRAFGELGLAFIKIGQILSMRYDILSRKDCEALQELLDNVNPIPVEKIFEIIEKEYDAPWRKNFSAFDEVPLGSASISQVHKARLINGALVAVKVKRPDVDKKFSSDIRILKFLARSASFFSPTLRHFQIRSLVDYFEKWIFQDLDFILEAKNMKRIKEQYSFGEKIFRHDLGKGMFPAPFNDLCTENIIVMDFIDGIPMSRREDILANPEYDIEKSIKTYINAAMRNWFRDDISTYLFQGDPHLSNILALPRGDVANIDCGLVSELPAKEVRQCKDLVVAVYLKDIERAVAVAIEMTGVDYETYAPVLRNDIAMYLKKTESQGIGFWFLEFTKVMIKNRIKFPLFLTTFGRTNIILDGLASTYLPDQNTVDILGGELRRQAFKEIIENITDVDLLKVAYAFGEKMKKTPEIAIDLLDRYFENPLQAVKDFREALGV